MSFNSGTTSKDNSIAKSDQWHKQNTVIMILEKFEGLLARPVLAVPPTVVIPPNIHITCQTTHRFLSQLQVHLVLDTSGCTMPMKAYQILPGHSFRLYQMITDLLFLLCISTLQSTWKVTRTAAWPSSFQSHWSHAALTKHNQISVM